MSLDLAVFAAPDFDPNDYANAILAAEPYPTPVVISKLSLAIEDTSKQIKNLVATHHEDLLSQASGAIHLSGSLASVKTGLSDLESSLDKSVLSTLFYFITLISVLEDFVSKFVRRINHLVQDFSAFRNSKKPQMSYVAHLDLSFSPADFNCKCFKLIVITRTLRPNRRTGLCLTWRRTTRKGQSQKRPSALQNLVSPIAKFQPLCIHIHSSESLAGPKNSNHVQIIAFHEETISTISLRSINAVAAHIPFIEEARAKVASEMENMVLTGLTTLVRPFKFSCFPIDPSKNQSLLASSLQTAYNLRVLPDLVRNLILDLSQAVEERICSAFDISKISKDALAKGTLLFSSQFWTRSTDNLYVIRLCVPPSIAVPTHLSVTSEDRTHKYHRSSIYCGPLVSPRGSD